MLFDVYKEPWGLGCDRGRRGTKLSLKIGCIFTVLGRGYKGCIRCARQHYPMSLDGGTTTETSKI